MVNSGPGVSFAEFTRKTIEKKKKHPFFNIMKSSSQFQ